MMDVTSLHRTNFNSSTMDRLMPEPKSGLSFGSVLSGVKDLVSAGSSTIGIDGEYASLIEKQMEMQEQMMLVSMVSNTEKTTHETRMAAVRNIRVS